MQPVARRLGVLLADSLEVFAASEAAPANARCPSAHAPGKQRQRGFNHAELLARAAIARCAAGILNGSCIWKPICCNECE